ncbi:microtubule-associated tumor suppressor 1 homolog isoform X2 [Esox lucius]|uniref:microtubule-associated tumor suppressor 1 homolog isoform X2 n=1 Tax=Esox lucius TaxID=8010 RepID=UPI0014774B4C|nr:microtubule-associated tumor suppressor 1 homolog isoform X2 [Esox lucius]
MSVPANLQSMSVNGREMKNNNKSQPPPTRPIGDANANQLALTREDGEGTREVLVETQGHVASSPLLPLVAQREAQDKLMIWDREKQSVGRDLRHFELLDCCEIHNCHEDGEEEKEDGGEDSNGGGDDGLMSMSSSSTASSVSAYRNDNDSNGKDGEIDQERGMDRARETEVEKGEEREKIGGNERDVLLRSSEDLDDGNPGSEGGKERTSGEQRKKVDRIIDHLKEAQCLSENKVSDTSLSMSAVSPFCVSLDKALDPLSCTLLPNFNPNPNLDPNHNRKPMANSYVTTSALNPGRFKKRAPLVDQNRNSSAAAQSQETPDSEVHQYQRSADQGVHNQNQETPTPSLELLGGQSTTQEQGSNQDIVTQRQELRYSQGSIHFSSDRRMGQKKMDGEKVLPLPRRQQLVRPLCQSEPGKGRAVAEPNTWRHSSPSQSSDADPMVMDLGHGGVNDGHTQEILEIKSARVNNSNYSHNLSNSQPSSSPGDFQPSQASRPALREARSLGRQVSSVGRNSSPTSPTSPSSSLERRRQYKAQSQFTYCRSACSSPNRHGATPTTQSHTPPPSPLRTPQGSPWRQQQQQQLMSPSRIITGTARYPQGCGSSGLRPPLKSNLTSGIPKPPLHHQPALNPGTTDRSPPPKCPPKPKGVRPKIITYVRKGPQLKPQASDGPYQVSTLPSRLSAYTHTHSPRPAIHPATTPTPRTCSSSPDTHTNVKSCVVAESRNPPVLSASNLLYDKYRQEMQRNRLLSSGPMGPGLRPPGHTHTLPPTHTHSPPDQHSGTNAQTHSCTAPPKLASKAESVCGPPVDKFLLTEKGRKLGSPSREEPTSSRMVSQAADAYSSCSLLRSSRGLRPQLGLGAVARGNPGSGVVTATKSQMMVQSQRSALGFSQPVQAVSPATNQNGHEITGGYRRPSTTPSTASAHTSRTLLPKSGQTGLRAPGFSSARLSPGSSGLPGPGRLAGFSFVRTSSVSSVSSLQSVDSTQSEPCRPGPSVGDDPPHHRGTDPPSTDLQRPGGPRNYSPHGLQPPSTPALPRRYLPAQPRGSPVGVRKEFQRSSEITRSLPSSPKRLAVVPPKPQSPVLSRQRPAGTVPTGSPRRVAPFRPQQDQQENMQKEKEEAQRKEREREQEERNREREKQREEVQRLQSRCEEQDEQLRNLRNELKATNLGLQAFIITTQHYCLQNESAEEKEKDLFLEIHRIKEEVASNTAEWRRLQRDKAELEVGFEREFQELQLQQEKELAAVEAELRACNSKETQHLRAEHQEEVEEIRAQQQEQIEELMVNHEVAIQELRDMHNITMTTLHEEHARTMRDLRKSFEQQKANLEENFEKLRLSLQDQVDTLTFQNRSLRDKAKRFEEALRKSTDEKIQEALAPYQHIEEDLKSLKDVVVMKNTQIHQQEKKISDLERVAQKNVVLEERIHVLQQQNEDLMARIDNNLALSRQLSEENANLQENVEKESSEKKRLSRNNEELLWRLQTSPLCSPCSSPLHQSFSTSPLPSCSLFSSSPGTGGGQGIDYPIPCCEGYPPPTPTYCHSPSHKTNQNQSPGLATPTHRAFSNQNQSPGPATPTHREFSNQNQSQGPAMPTHRGLSNQNPTLGPTTPTHRASPSHCHSPARLNPLMR